MAENSDIALGATPIERAGVGSMLCHARELHPKTCPRSKDGDSSSAFPAIKRCKRPRPAVDEEWSVAITASSTARLLGSSGYDFTLTTPSTQESPPSENGVVRLTLLRGDRVSRVGIHVRKKTPVKRDESLLVESEGLRLGRFQEQSSLGSRAVTREKPGFRAVPSGHRKSMNHRRVGIQKWVSAFYIKRSQTDAPDRHLFCEPRCGSC